MSEFYLVRHGQASFGAKNYDKLSELGHQQARWLGEYLTARDITFSQAFMGDMAVSYTHLTLPTIYIV